MTALITNLLCSSVYVLVMYTYMNMVFAKKSSKTYIVIFVSAIEIIVITVINTYVGDANAAALTIIICVVSYLTLFDVSAGDINTQMKYESQIRYYELIHNNERELSTLKNEIKSEVLALKDGNSDTDFHINKILGKIDDMGAQPYCEDALVNYILNKKFSKMQIPDDNLKIYIETFDPKEFEPDDIAMILDNVLEDSIEALDKIEIYERKLSIDLYIYKRSILVKISNTINLEKSGSHISASVRSGEVICNADMSLVREIVDRYNGMFNVSYEGNMSETDILLNSKS